MRNKLLIVAIIVLAIGIVLSKSSNTPKLTEKELRDGLICQNQFLAVGDYISTNNNILTDIKELISLLKICDDEKKLSENQACSTDQKIKVLLNKIKSD